MADSIADVEAAARPDSLLLVAQTQYLVDNALLDRLAKAPVTCCWWHPPHELVRR
ncbi:hypothetical protein RN09_4507 [Mycobacterium tuberculosis variant africanum]|nr:hypothetical protein RN09_4507 [Mycobacterium tuberculosis variant africanum]